MPCPRYSIKSNDSHHSTPRVEANRNALLEDLFFFPNSFTVSVWLENQAALAEEKCLCSASFSFPGCVQMGRRLPCHQNPCWGEVLTTGGCISAAWQHSPWQRQKRPSRASQSLNVHPNGFGRFQAHLYFISPNLRDAKREIWTCFQTLELRKISIFIEHF